MTKVHPENEQERLDALDALGIMHSKKMPEFDAVVETIASIFECPIALISFVGKDEQWFKAKCGLDTDSTSRDVSFCQHALLSEDMLIINDALEDNRFRNNPLVVDAPRVRFYAGCPLTLDGRNNLGTLCILDHVPRFPSIAQLEQLKRMGKVVEGLIKAHQAANDTEKAVAEADAEHEIAVRKGSLLEEVANLSGVGGWETCLKTNTMTWTEKTREIHEVPDDYVPTPDLALAFYPLDSRDRISKAIKHAIDAHSGWDIELPFVTAKGRNIWIRSAGRPVIERGEVTRLIGAFQDISERKRAETTIRYSEARQRSTLQALSEGVLLLSRTGVIQSINSAGAKLLGYTPEELTGSRVNDLEVKFQFDGKNKSRSRALLQLAATHPAKVDNVVTYVIRKRMSGGVWVRMNASPIDAGNEYGLEGIVVSLKDISESRLQEETLKAVFDNFPGGIVCRDKDMNLTTSNESFREFFNLPEDLIARKANRLEFMRFQAERGDFGPGDPDTLVQERVASWNLSGPTQEERTIADGRVLDARSTPLPDGGVVFSFFDITERKRAEQTIRRSEAVQRTTLEALSEGILLLTRSGDIQSSNPAAANLLGFDDGDLIGLNVEQLDLDMICEIEGIGTCTTPLTMAAREPHIMSDVMAKLSMADGTSTQWLRINARSIDQESGSGFEGIVVSLTDITETKQQADTLQVIFDNFPGGVAHYDEHFQLASCNADYGKLLDYPQELIDQKLHILDYLKYTAEHGAFGPGDPEQLALTQFEDIHSKRLNGYERSTVDGRYLEIRSTRLPTGGSIFNFFDVTERKEMEKELADSERLARHRLEELEAILANMRQGVSVFDENGKLTLWNRQYIDIFDKPEDDVKKGVSLIELIEGEKARGQFDGDVRQHVMDLMIRLSSGEVVRSKFAHHNGRIVSVVQTPLPGGGWIGTHEDITLREQAAAKITFAAHHDELTGLPNRALFNATLNEILTDAQIQNTHGHLLLLDLDRFKPVNDTYGHDVGDELLKQASQRLRDCVRSTDLVARLGGDEFGIILRETWPGSGRPIEVAERILHAFQVPFNLFAHKIQVGVSLGIAKINENAVERAAIIKEADMALYDVKKTGRNGFRFFDQMPVIRSVRG